MHLYLLPEDDSTPRSLILCTSSEEERQGCPARALIFRVAQSRSTSQAIVEFLPKKEVDLSSVVRLTPRPVYGCVGLINIANDIFLAVVTASSSVGSLRPTAKRPEEVNRIQQVMFFGVNTSSYDAEALAAAEGALPSPTFQSGIDRPDDNLMRDPYYGAGMSQVAQPAYFEHPCASVVKIFGSGTFYYAPYPSWDLSSRLELRIQRAREIQQRSGSHVDVEVDDPFVNFDDRFIWNEYVVKSLLEFRERLDPSEQQELDQCQFIILAVQGYVGTFKVQLPAAGHGGPTVGTVSLISRLGWKRAGTRFNTRGVDDDGNVANFVETETIFSTEASCLSFTQVRGSVPLFWEQQGLQTFRPTVQITRSQPASQPAFDRHFNELLEEYEAVHAINLLGTKENEAALTDAYSRHLRALQMSGVTNVDVTHYDFHHQVKMGGHDSVTELRRLPGVRSGLDKFGFTTVDGTDVVVTEQHGVFRTNCLDCLDRTNFVQDILSKTSIELYFMQVRPEWRQCASLWTFHRELWAENGDALSKIYAGTGALNTSFTRTGKRTLGGLLADATKSVSRAYINNFQDKNKQIAIDMFLGNLTNQKQVSIFDPIHDSVRAALQARLNEYSTLVKVNIFVGTWNLNGKPPSESLLPWLFPRPYSPEPDLFVLGFQEIVPLNAQQILQTDPEKKRVWERVILEELSRRPNKKSEYIILRSDQLVGTALIILVRSTMASAIRKVEGTTRKTGLRGMSGNKGAVGIRMDIYDTSFCFVTAHLAAGHINVEERNADYRTIAHGLHFLKGKTIDSHDNVVWAADTNYRINLDYETAKQYATEQVLDPLVAQDQLRAVMDARLAFDGYEEGPILFPPTYRYDLNSDTYDTSEKMRIPAWTDRILYKGYNLDLNTYHRSELKGSDHRPVFAIFRAEVRSIDHAKKSELAKKLLQGVTSHTSEETLDEKLAGMVFEERGRDLPPPSSEEHAWWDTPENPGGVYDGPLDGDETGNPFDSKDRHTRRSLRQDSSLISSPSASDDELYKTAIAATHPTSKAKPPQPPTPNRATKPSQSHAIN